MRLLNRCQKNKQNSCTSAVETRNQYFFKKNYTHYCKMDAAYCIMETGRGDPGTLSRVFSMVTYLVRASACWERRVRLGDFLINQCRWILDVPVNLARYLRLHGSLSRCNHNLPGHLAGSFRISSATQQVFWILASVLTDEEKKDNNEVDAILRTLRTF